MANSQPTSKNAEIHTRIQPSRGWRALDLRELWDYRELLYFLVWREIKVRYKQTILGMAWAVLQPFLTMVVFSIFFGRFAGVPSDGVPYPVFSYTGLVPWTYFANSVSLGSNSLVANARVITKIYFPRLALPLSAVLSPLVDFSLAFIVLIIPSVQRFHVGIGPDVGDLDADATVIRRSGVPGAFLQIERLVDRAVQIEHEMDREAAYIV